MKEFASFSMNVLIPVIFSNIAASPNPDQSGRFGENKTVPVSWSIDPGDPTPIPITSEEFIPDS